MKNFFRTIGIIAMVAVIGFTMAGCKEDGAAPANPGTPGTPNPTPVAKTVVISGVKPEMKPAGSASYFVGVFPAVATKAQVEADATAYLEGKAMTNAVAVGGAKSALASALLANGSLNVALKTASALTEAWKGNGTYSIWFVCNDGTDTVSYKRENYSVTAAGGTITIPTDTQLKLETDSAEKTIEITGVTSDMKSEGSTAYFVGVFSKGAPKINVETAATAFFPVADAFEVDKMTNLVAFGGDDSSALTASLESDGTTLKVSLTDVSNITKVWKGYGEFDIWVACNDGTDTVLYKKANVLATVTDGTITIPATGETGLEKDND